MLDEGTQEHLIESGAHKYPISINLLLLLYVNSSTKSPGKKILLYIIRFQLYKINFIESLISILFGCEKWNKL